MTNKKRALRSFAPRCQPIGLPPPTPEGAFYVFPNVSSTGLSSTEFAHRLLKEESVAVVPGTAFSPHAEGYIRCAYALGMEDLEIAMSRISTFVQRIRPNQQTVENNQICEPSVVEIQ